MTILLYQCRFKSKKPLGHLFSIITNPLISPSDSTSLVAQLVKNPPVIRRPQFNSWVRKILWTRDRLSTPVFLGFPCGSAGKESAHNARDLGSIPGSGRSTGEGIGYTLQYSWAFLVAQLVKNLPAMQETWVQSLGWEDPLEKGRATHSSILAWRIPWTV